MDNQFSRQNSETPEGSQQYGDPAPAQSQPVPAAHYEPEKRGGFFKYLLILLLIAVAAGGVYYWQNQKVSDLNKKLTDASAQADSISAQFATFKNDANALATSAEPSAVTIKEISQQLTLSGSLKDLTYKAFDVNYKKGSNTLATYPTAYLSTKALDGLESGKCASTAFKSDSVPPLGYLTKTTGQYPKAPTADNSTGTLVKQYSAYYISYRAPASGCFTDAKNNETAKKLRDQLLLVLNPLAEK